MSATQHSNNLPDTGDCQEFIYVRYCHVDKLGCMEFSEIPVQYPKKYKYCEEVQI